RAERMFAKTDCKQVSFYSFRGPVASCLPGEKIVHLHHDDKGSVGLVRVFAFFLLLITTSSVLRVKITL
ncbi:MAG: hypothetical protein L0312_26150, partial [Acidobacteria bacterium]|nr:hypothetical protein [Acidobacteriota bacterium]